MDTIYNRDGCFYRALDDEPVFVLLARDPCTPEAIRWWVTLRQALIGQGQKPLEDHAMLADALKTATDAHIWRQDATDIGVGGEARWHSEKAPARELVEVGELERLRELEEPPTAPNGSVRLQYDDWIKWKADAMPLGNRFLLGVYQGRLYFSEFGPMKEALGEEWSGLYLVQKSLQRDMLQAAYTDWTKATRRTVDTVHRLMDITDLVDLPPEEGRPDAILRKRLEPYADDARVSISAGALRKVLRAMPFVAVDLAAKIAVGLRQVTGDLLKQREAMPSPTAAARWAAFEDRINGYAAELEEGSMIGKTLQSRPIAQRPFGISDSPWPMTPAQAIETIGSVTGTVFDGEAMRPKAETDMVDVTELADMPPHRFAMFTKSEGWAYGRGLEINPSHIPAMLDRMEQDGYYLIAALGSQADKVGMVFRRRRLFELATGSDASVLSMPCGGEGEPPCGPAGMGRGLEP